MYFAVVAKSGQDNASGVSSEKSGDFNIATSETKKTSIWVYTSENHGSSIEVPLTPQTTVSDVLDCVRDPVRGEGYLVAVAGDTEYILQEGDNAFTFLYQIWNTSGSPLTFLLRYYSLQAEWPPPELEARRHQMRHPTREPTPAYGEKIPDKLPGGANDLTIAELQEMASRQQQQLEAQQQVLVAKEQRLKYLKQQEARHAQMATESERLRKIRERVESQELKLKKLRALKGQAEQYRSNNGNLNTELEAVKAVFSEKEKELAVAVARVDQLTRQLRDLRNGVTLNLTGNQQAAAVAELEKLRKELLIRNKLNEQQSNTIVAKEKLLMQRKEDVARMDMRIQELQMRLKRKKSQEQAAASQSKMNNVAMKSPTQGSDHQGSQVKQESRYQNIRINSAGKPDIEGRSMKSQEMNNNSEVVEEYKLPTVLPMDKGGKGSVTSPPYPLHQPPVPARSSFGKSSIDYVRPAAGQHNQVKKESKPPPVLTVRPPGSSNQKNLPMPPPRQPVTTGDTSSKPAPTSPGQVGVSGGSVHPVISINEEERQAGSGQSSPASSEASNSSAGIKGEEAGTSSIGSVSALVDRLNKNISHAPGQTSTQGSAGLIRPNFHNQRNHLASQEIRSNVLPLPDRPSQASSNNFPPQSVTVTSPGAEDVHSPKSSNGYPVPAHSPSLHLNQKPAPTYRYASKNQIANTYMGRLGGAAMERYQKNLNMIYKNLETDEHKPDASADREGTTSFLNSAAVDPSSPKEAVSNAHNYPDIASDKGSYKLNTPKHIRRRHSDSENEDLAKALQEHLEMEQQKQSSPPHQPLMSDGNVQSESGSSKPVTPSSPDKPTIPPASLETDKDPPSPSRESSNSSDSSPPGSPSSPPPLPAVKCSPSKIEMMLRRGKSNLKQEGGRRSTNRVSFDPLALLLDASLEGELELVKKVADQVDNVSTPNDEGITALHNAICAGHLDIVIFLVEFGCDVNSPDSDGWTPLHCAASCNNLAMVKFLVEHGACVFATTISDHETAADKCEEEEDGYDSCSDYLYSIQEKMGIVNNGEVYSVFDYQATNTDELSFQSGDKLTVLKKGDDVEKEWWWSRLNGNEGYIPRNLLGLYPRVTPQSKDVTEC